MMDSQPKTRSNAAPELSLCPECGYDRTGLPRCPECGFDDDTLVLRTLWSEWRIDPAEAGGLELRLAQFHRAMRWYVLLPICVFASTIVIQIVASWLGFFQSRVFEVLFAVVFALSGAVWLKLFVFDRLRLLLIEIPWEPDGPDGSTSRRRDEWGVWFGTGCSALLWGWIFLPSVWVIDLLALPMTLCYVVEVLAATRFPRSARWRGRDVMVRKSASLMLLGVPLCLGLFVWEALDYTPTDPAVTPSPGVPFGNTQLVAFFGWLILCGSLENGAKKLLASLRKAQHHVTQRAPNPDTVEAGIKAHEKAAAPDGNGRSNESD